MSDVAIRVQNLGKRYRIGAAEKQTTTLGQVLRNVVIAPFDYLIGTLRGPTEEEILWALKDVSFEVKHGEVVGVVGRNGAGKSTLLKVLSRITEPTEGRARVYGRVGSLLEVGTGFHPELTGRENIYLNGAILGMTRVEISRKFDEIVAFAGVEQFIDTPVKRYSSGMQVRLAFAVAAHLEPEILLVDEVLAVGDAEFQRKCFNKIRKVSEGGRTILFVSHNMAAIRNICHHGILLERGCLVKQGEINDIVDKYLAQTNTQHSVEASVETESFIVDDVQICSVKGSAIETFDSVEIKVRFTAKTDILDPGLYVGVLSLDNQRLTGLDFKDFCTAPFTQAGQQYELGFSVETLPLLPGSYQLEVYLKDMANYKIERVPQTYYFDIVETPVYGGRKIDQWYGFIGLHTQANAHIMLPQATSKPVE